MAAPIMSTPPLTVKSMTKLETKSGTAGQVFDKVLDASCGRREPAPIAKRSLGDDLALGKKALTPQLGGAIIGSACTLAIPLAARIDGAGNMLPFSLGWTEIIIVLIIALLLFGRRLPEVGRSLGRGIVEFKKGLRDVEDEVKAEIGDKKPDESRESSADTV